MMLKWRRKEPCIATQRSLGRVKIYYADILKGEITYPVNKTEMKIRDHILEAQMKQNNR